MHIEVEKTFAVACYSYLGLLLATLWWYRTRRSRIARYILALLIFLPALACMSIGISILGSWHAGAYPNPVSDAEALLIMIGIGMCIFGMFIARLAVRVVTRPLTPRKKKELQPTAVP